MPTKAQLQEDVDFLASMQYSFGLSAHSLIKIAYGKLPIWDLHPPDSQFDLDNVEKAWAALPEHRKKGDAAKAITRARLAINGKEFPDWYEWSKLLKKLLYENKISIAVTARNFLHHYNQLMTPQQVVDAIMKRQAND